MNRKFPVSCDELNKLIGRVEHFRTCARNNGYVRTNRVEIKIAFYKRIDRDCFAWTKNVL